MLLIINVADELPHVVEDDCKKYYYTACNIKYAKNRKNFTTLSHGSFIDNICPICLSVYKYHIQKNPSKDPRQAFSNQGFSSEILELNRLEMLGARAKFEYILEKRVYPFLTRVKRNVRHSK